MTVREDGMEGHSRAVGVYDLGTTSYGEVHKLQQRLQGQRREGGIIG